MAHVRDISELERFLATPASEVNDQIKLETVIKEEFEEIGNNISNLVKTEFVDVDHNFTNYEFKTEDMLEKEELNCSASIPSQLSQISFLHASHQYEKQYDVKFKPNSLHTSAKYYILTSDKDSNNTKAEWKLLVPVYNPTPISDLDMINMTVEHEADNMVLKHFSSALRVQYIKDLPSFMNAISSVYHVLIEDRNFQRIAEEFETQYNNRLIPSFQYKKEKGTFMFQTVMSELGYEGVPIIPTEKERLETINMVLKNLDESYPQEILPRVNDMAVLMEHDLHILRLPKSDMHARLISLKSNLVSRINEYPNLLKYPDILYQILRMSMLSQNSVKHKCRFCDYESDRKYYVKQHEKNKHEGIKCTFFDSRSDVKLHEKMMHDENQVIGEAMVCCLSIQKASEIHQSDDNLAVFVKDTGGVEEEAQAGMDPLKAKFDRKKFVTPYILFSADIRKTVTKENPGIKFGDASRLIAEKWRKVSPELKSKYEEKAKKRNEEKEKAELYKETMKEAEPIKEAEKSNKDIWKQLELSSSTIQRKVENPISCPFPVNRCAKRIHKGITELVEHLNAHHFRTLLDSKVRLEQTETRIHGTECPYQPCGFIAPSRFELLRHYGQQHQVVGEFLIETAKTQQLDLTELTKIGFFKKDPVNMLNYGNCEICLRKVHLLHMSAHKALVHCKDHYLAEIKEKQNSSQASADSCPQPDCQFSVKNETSSVRDILLIKHFQAHFTVKDITKKYNLNFNAGLRASVKMKGNESEINEQLRRKRKYSKDEESFDENEVFNKRTPINDGNHDDAEFDLISIIKEEETVIE